MSVGWSVSLQNKVLSSQKANIPTKDYRRRPYKMKIKLTPKMKMTSKMMTTLKAKMTQIENETKEENELRN